MVFVEFVVYEILALYAGWIGITELSAISLILNLGTLTFAVPYALHLTICVFIGNSLGKGDHKLAIRYAKMSVLLGASTMITLGVVFILIR